MTEIAKATHDPIQRAKWRVQAAKIAEHLKAVKDWGEHQVVTAGVVFDDQLLKVKLDVALIQRLNVEALTQALFDAALEVQRIPDAAQQGADVAPSSSEGAPVPAGAAAVEKCWRRLEPAFNDPCPNDATGGVRLVLYPAEHLQKRYGRRPLLSLILDLPVCDSCFPKMTALSVVTDGLAPGQWGDISRFAQQRNQGVLPIKENSVIEHIPFDHQEYVALRAHIAKSHAANGE